jgi:pimeloyl-ACP methyl ester carboxylesterase
MFTNKECRRLLLRNRLIEKVSHPGRVLGATATAVALADFGYQAAAEARDRCEHLPPGRLIDVGGRRLHIRCAGKGTPPVVIIPALGGFSAQWLAVQEGLAACTEVCVYDRAGLGWSDPARGWPTVVGMATELHALLDAARVPRPFVLAGHSLGGLLARVYRQLYPHEVVGLALIDSSHPQQSARLPKTGLRSCRGGKLVVAALELARPLALRRIRRSLASPTPYDAIAAQQLFSSYRRAWLKEMLAFDAICRDTDMVVCDLGDLPLTVVTSSERAPGLPEDSSSQRSRSTFYPAWLALQKELAALSTNSVHVVAEQAGHLLHDDDPELVTRTIADLVRRVRAATPSP